MLGIPMRQMLSVQIQQDGIRYGLITEIGSVGKNRADITVKSIEELKEVIRGQIG